MDSRTTLNEILNVTSQEYITRAQVDAATDKWDSIKETVTDSVAPYITSCLVDAFERAIEIG